MWLLHIIVIYLLAVSDAMHHIVASRFKRSVFTQLRDRLVCRTDDPFSGADLLDAVRAPTGDSRDCEKRRIKFRRNAQHSVDKPRIKVNICTNILVVLLIAGEYRG